MDSENQFKTQIIRFYIYKLKHEDNTMVMHLYD